MNSAMLEFEKLLSTSRQRQWGKVNSSRRLVLLANWKLESEFRRLLAREGPERAWQPASEAIPLLPTTCMLQLGNHEVVPGLGRGREGFSGD
jgi:hypothetical protein